MPRTACGSPRQRPPLPLTWSRYFWIFQWRSLCRPHWHWSDGRERQLVMKSLQDLPQIPIYSKGGHGRVVLAHPCTVNNHIARIFECRIDGEERFSTSGWSLASVPPPGSLLSAVAIAATNRLAARSVFFCSHLCLFFSALVRHIQILHHSR